jgi:hypothetical protein
MMFETLLSLNFIMAVLFFSFVSILGVNIIASLVNFFLDAFIKAKKL